MANKATEQLAQYRDILNYEAAVKAVELPLKFSGQEAEFVIPSIALGPEGPRIVSLVLLTKEYLSEIRLDVPGMYFDYAYLLSIENIRFALNEQKIERQGELPLLYSTAQVVLTHRFNTNTVLTYAGRNRDAWLDHLRRALPLSLLVSHE
jgi:hypothetical protein